MSLCTHVCWAFLVTRYRCLILCMLLRLWARTQSWLLIVKDVPTLQIYLKERGVRSLNAGVFHSAAVTYERGMTHSRNISNHGGTLQICSFSIHKLQLYTWSNAPQSVKVVFYTLITLCQHVSGIIVTYIICGEICYAHLSLLDDGSEAFHLGIICSSVTAFASQWVRHEDMKRREMEWEMLNSFCVQFFLSST